MRSDNLSKERGIYLMRIDFIFDQMWHVISRVNSQLMQFTNLHFDIIYFIPSVFPLYIKEIQLSVKALKLK